MSGSSNPSSQGVKDNDDATPFGRGNVEIMLDGHCFVRTEEEAEALANRILNITSNTDSEQEGQ